MCTRKRLAEVAKAAAQKPLLFDVINKLFN